MPEEMIAEVSAILRKKGWKTAWSAATPSKVRRKGRKKIEPTQGGTAICVRDFLGLTSLDDSRAKQRGGSSGFDLVPGRLCGAKVCLPGGRNLACYSVYLWCSERLSQRNRGVLAELGKSVGAHKLEWAAGGDYNMTPATLEKSGFPMKCGARIAAPDGPTCFGAGKPATLDYFLLSAGLCQADKEVMTVKCAAIRPHLVSRLEFVEKLDEQEVVRIKWVRPISKEQPFGPRAPFQDWREVELDCEAALWKIKRGEAENPRKEFAETDGKWMKNAEKEIRRTTDDIDEEEAAKKYRSRWGLTPVFVKEPMLKKR